METPLLNDKEVLPTKEVLENVLGESYLAYSELIETITNTKYGLVTEWNYYKDGKAWLCKVCFKKKTVFWLSVWDKYFKIGFYFTEKNCAGVAALEIEEKIKEDFNNSKHIGKLIPLGITMNRKEQIIDVLKIIEYKKNLK
jgi:hypothetical protein